MRELQRNNKDKIEIVKQQQKKQTIVLQKRIIPHENHILFEFDLKSQELRLAKYEPLRKEIHWIEAVEIHQKKIIDKVDIFNPNPKVKSKVIQEPNCIYISALNFKNAKKHLKEDYGIII
jgi:hypothetical protein